MVIPPEATLFVENEGTIFRDQFVDEDGAAIDVSTASALRMRFTYPNGTSIDGVPVFDPDPPATGDGTDGRVRFIPPDGFLAVGGVGTWKRQTTAVLAGGAEFSGAIRTFPVAANLEP